MANDPHRQLFQEALDEALTPELRQEFQRQLDREPELAAQFNRLKQVDNLLRTAPFERAPARLALNIMARLTESLKTKEMPRTSAVALALGLSLAAVVVLPLLVGAAWMFLSAISSAAALNALIQQIVSLFALLLAMLQIIIDRAQTLMANDPQAPLVMVALIPFALFYLLRYALEQQQNAAQTGAANAASG